MLKGGWLVVFITTNSLEEAEKLAKGIVEKNLGACVNIVKDIESIYLWKGNIENDKEYLLVIKTRIDVFDELVEYVKSNHSYEVPEIIGIPVIIGYTKYLDWLEEAVKKNK